MAYFWDMETIVRKTKLALIAIEDSKASAESMLKNAHTDVMRNYLNGKIHAYENVLIELGAILRSAQQAA